MDDKVRQAIERLFSACLELSATGKRLAFFEWAPHVGDIDVNVFDGGSSWKASAKPPIRRLAETVSIYGARAGHPEITVQRLEALITQLNELTQRDAA